MVTTIFVILILGGLGFPFPEELPLFWAGMIYAKGGEALQNLFLVCYLGVLIGDQTMYMFGYFFGQKLLSAGTRSRFLPGITAERIQEVRDGLRKRRLVALFVGRHLFFLRSATFVIAGSLHIPFLEFLLADAAAALISVSLFIWLGYMFGEHVSPEFVSHLSHQASLIVFAIIVGAVGVWYLRRKSRLRKDAALKPIVPIDPDLSEIRRVRNDQ